MPLPPPARDNRNAPVGKTGNNAEPHRASGRGAGKPVRTKPAKEPGRGRKPA